MTDKESHFTDEYTGDIYLGKHELVVQLETEADVI